MASTRTAGSAERWGPLWGARAADWAANEELQVPTYSEAIARLGLVRGQRVLDVGCGSGVFLRLAVGRGADVAGVDASERLIEIARAQVPEADLEVGEMQALPYDDDSFDVVTGFNAFFFADDMVAALREAGRVTKPGGRIVIQVWGAPGRNDLEPMKEIARRFMPARPDEAAPPPPPLWKAGVLEQLAREAGLDPESAFDIEYPFLYPDEETLGRLLVAPAGIAETVGPEREPELRRAIAAALARRRLPDGSYRLQNEFHFVIARV